MCVSTSVAMCSLTESLTQLETLSFVLPTFHSTDCLGAAALSYSLSGFRIDFVACDMSHLDSVFYYESCN